MSKSKLVILQSQWKSKQALKDKLVYGALILN